VLVVTYRGSVVPVVLLRRLVACFLAALLAAVTVTAVGAGPAAAAVPTAQPELQAPAQGQTGPGNPVFAWGPVAGASKYRFQVSTSSTFASTVYTVDTVALHAAPPTELPLGTLHWRVAGMSAAAEVGPYATSSFVKSASAAPVPNAPGNGLDLPYPATSPVLRWSVLSGIKNYEVEVDDADDFIGAKVYPTANTALAVTDPLILGKRYYWRVRGASATGVTTAWSATSNFRMVWGDAQGQPVLRTPVLGSDVEDIAFSWTGQAQEPGSTQGVLGSRSYQLQVSPNDDFTNNIREDVIVKGTRYSPATTYAAGGYFWRVRAVATGPTGSVQNGPWSDTSQFTRSWTDRADLSYPVGGQEVVRDDLRFRWSSVQHASSYELRLSPEPNFNAPEVCTTLHTSLTPHIIELPQTVPASTIGSDCTFTPVPGSIYYWQVRGIDAGPAQTRIEGVWSSTESFLYDETGVSLVSPREGASVSAPVLQWNPVPGYHRYAVTLTRMGSTPQTTTGLTYSTSWSPLTASSSLGAGSYEWYVQGVDPDGVRTPIPFFGRGRFTVVAPTTTTPVPASLVTEFGGRTSEMPSMTWTDVAGASYYRVWYAPQGSTTYVQLTRSADRLPQAAFTYAGTNTALPASTRETFPAGTYSWFVQAYSSTDSLVGTSVPASFVVTPTGYVTYTSPARDDAGPDVPELRWSADPFAYEYRVHLALDPNFTNQLRVYRTGRPSLTPREVLPDNQAGQSYYWYVQVCRSPLVTSCGPLPQAAYGAGAQYISSFRKTSPPVALLDPPATGGVVTDQVVLRWDDYHVTDPAAPGARAYRVDVASDPAFTVVVDTATVDQPFYAPAAKVYPDNVYYWRVQALDGTSQRLTYSVPRSFQKTSRKPSGLDSDVVSGLPTLSWAALGHAGTYAVELYRGTEGSFPAVNKVSLPAGAATLSYTAFTPDKPLAPGTYSWRVRKNDVDGNPGTWAGDGAGPTTIDTFTVAAPPVGLLQPADGAVLSSSDTLFTWAGFEGASAYRFETSTADSFATFFEQQKTVGTTWVSPKYYADGTTYRWRVVALNNVDQVIGTSATRTFTKNEVSITLSSSANPAPAGQALTLSVAVTRPGTAPTGTVTFKDGTTVLGTGKLTAGVATFTTSALSVGSHSLTATWAGDAGSAAATTTVLSQTVAPSGAVYSPVTPTRVMSFQRVSAGGTYTLTLPNVPTGATAVALNVTAANPSADTYVSACPAGTSLTACKAASNINPYKGRNTPNMVVVKLGSGGKVTFYNNSGTVQLIADVQGWFSEGGAAGATYRPVTPTRAMSFQQVGAGQVHTLTLPGVPTGATAVALNVTAANPTTNTYVSVCPGGTALTTCNKASNLNPYKGTNTPNLVIVKLGTGGKVSFYNDSGSVQLIADVQGWFVSGGADGTYLPVTPTRAMAFRSVPAGGTYTLTLPSVPAGATAVTLNVTSANQTADTYVSVCPGGTATLDCKKSSSLNPYVGRNIANTVVVKLGTGGKVTFYNDSGSAQLIADVQGWFVE